ncbi:hypothetical protein [Actinomadura geliboluensis]
MTNSSFVDAFEAFRAMPYPGYPHSPELQDVNSHLLVLDAGLAGYATRVFNGTMRAGEIPELGLLVENANSLTAMLEMMNPSLEEDRKLIQEYRAYIFVLSSMLAELSLLAEQD